MSKRLKMRLTLSILLLFIISQLHAQNRVEGYVVDEDNRPIPYATVLNSTSDIGVITNADGKFAIEGDLNSTLEINCLGYQGYQGPLSQCQNATVILLAAQFTIDEVVVSPTDAKSIVQDAIDYILQNYNVGTTRINGVYKQLAMLGQQNTGLFEADMDIYLWTIGLRTQSKYETKVNHYDLCKDSTYFILSSLRYNLDHLKIYNHPFIDKPNRFRYNHMGKIAYQGDTLIKVSFRPKRRKLYKQQYEGDVYIEQESKAFVYFDYNLIPNQCGFYNHHGTIQRHNADMNKLMFKKKGRYYNVSYLLKESSFTVKDDNDSLFTYNNLFNFHTKSVDYENFKYNPDTLSVYDLIDRSQGKAIGDKKYINGFILETEAEKQLKLELEGK